jgi:hypothetical protein
MSLYRRWRDISFKNFINRVGVRGRQYGSYDICSKSRNQFLDLAKHNIRIVANCPENVHSARLAIMNARYMVYGYKKRKSMHIFKDR